MPPLEASYAVPHYGVTFTGTGSDVLVVGNPQPTLDPDFAQPYRIVCTGTKDVVLEDDIFAHLLEFIGHGLRERGVDEDHAAFLGISQRNASFICLGVTSKS